jgi:hypothetical protein
VLDLRRRWQALMKKKDVSREIEQVTGRKVIGFMSDNHIDPDLAVEVFVPKPAPERGRSLAVQAANPGGLARALTVCCRREKSSSPCCSVAAVGAHSS